VTAAAWGRPVPARPVAGVRTRRDRWRAALRTAAVRAARTRAVASARTLLPDAAGLGLLSAAAWQVSTGVGLAAAGIACLIFGWRVNG
jgi:hypothetical protein